MSFLVSNFNLSVFELPKDFKLKPAEIYDKLVIKKFVDIQPSQANCHGWVAIDNIFKSDFTYEDSIVGSTTVVGYRYDVKKVSNILVKKLYVDRLKARFKTGEKPSKEEKKVLHEMCHDELILKALPSPCVIGCIFDLDKNLIYIDTTNDKALDSFNQLFMDTFNITLELKDYGLNVMDGFLDWVWKKAGTFDRMWLDKSVVFKEEADVINISSSSLADNVEQIDKLRKDKKVKKLGITAALNDLDYSIMFSDKSLNVSVKSTPKIKHENVETAIIDNLDRISGIMSKIQFLVTEFLKD